MIAKYLWEAASALIFIMGAAHLRGTLSSNLLHPRDGKLIAEMKVVSPFMTDKLKMWPSWIGFNAAHSNGAIFAGAINFYIAFRHFELLQTELFFPLLTIAMNGFYVWIAARYWFKTVLLLLSIPLVLFIAATLLIYAH